MTFAEIKAEIMFQTNNDAEDIEDYLPYVVDYINDGYDRLMNVWEKDHVPGSHDRLEYDRNCLSGFTGTSATGPHGLFTATATRRNRAEGCGTTNPSWLC